VALKICFFSMAFIIEDSQSQEKMGGRYLASAMLPGCVVLVMLLQKKFRNDDPNHDCNSISMYDVNLCPPTAWHYANQIEYDIRDELDDYDEN